jgi:hypothetical protein
MTNIVITDLAVNKPLDQKALSNIRGGQSNIPAGREPPNDTFLVVLTARFGQPTQPQWGTQ